MLYKEIQWGTLLKKSLLTSMSTSFCHKKREQWPSLSEENGLSTMTAGQWQWTSSWTYTRREKCTLFVKKQWDVKKSFICNDPGAQFDCGRTGTVGMKQWGAARACCSAHEEWQSLLDSIVQAQPDKQEEVIAGQDNVFSTPKGKPSIAMRWRHQRR